MQPYEIKQKMLDLSNPMLNAQILGFNNWKDPADFYDISTKERRALLSKYKAVSVELATDNQWIWFGAYDIKGYPKYNSGSIPVFLYNVMIKPTNGARIRGLLNNTKSDVNPFKYFEALRMTPLEVLKVRSNTLDIPLTELMTSKQNEQFENKVQLALEEVKEYYMVGSPTETREFMRKQLLNSGHMPIAVDEAMARSGLEFK